MYTSHVIRSCDISVYSLFSVQFIEFNYQKHNLMHMWMYTLFIYTAVLPPTNVRATVLTPRSVVVTWEPPPSSNIISYLISYTTTALYTSGGSMSVDGTTTSHTLTNLEEGTLYNITVQATNSSGTSANSN